MITPIIAGKIFVTLPFNVVYLLTGLAVANIFVTFWMFYMGKRHESYLQQKSESSPKVHLTGF